MYSSRGYYRLLYQQKEMSSLHFGLNVVCLFETGAREVDAVYTSTAVPVFLGRGLHVRFVRLCPRIGRQHRVQNAIRLLLAESIRNNPCKLVPSPLPAAATYRVWCSCPACPCWVCPGRRVTASGCAAPRSRPRSPHVVFSSAVWLGP